MPDPRVVNVMVKGGKNIDVHAQSPLPMLLCPTWQSRRTHLMAGVGTILQRSAKSVSRREKFHGVVKLKVDVQGSYAGRYTRCVPMRTEFYFLI
jgi:hypothetical protein